MIMVNAKMLCENCFMETDQEPCPYCSFDKEHKPDDNAVLRMGSVLDGRYMIGGVIGKGGFGITYLAYDIKLEKRIAVKEYYPRGIATRGNDHISVSAADDDSKKTFMDGAERFYKEAELVSQFNGNPYIVNVYDFFRENDTVYFTMGYLQGETLKTYLNDSGRITEGQAMNVYNCVTNALLITHSMNILHRDISPDNIMLCSDGTIKLLDFGAARQVIAEESHSLSVILKQGFAPLEQYQRKGKQGPWTDIYALGATIYTALTGDHLDDPMSRMEDDSEFEANNHGISDGLWGIIRKSTMLKIGDRYQDIIGLKKDLSAIKIKEESFSDIGLPEIKTEDRDLNDETELLSEAAQTADPNETVLLTERSRHDDNETVLLNEQEAVFTNDPGLQDDKAEKPVAKEERKAAKTVRRKDKRSSKNDEKIRKAMIFAAAAFIFVLFIGYRFRPGGKCGDDARWNYKNGIMTISGSGDIDKYPSTAYRAKEIIVEDGITGIPKNFIACYKTSLFKRIKSNKFREIKKVTLADSVDTIGSYAFQNWNIDEIDMPEEMVRIDAAAFQECERLESIDLPSGIDQVNVNLFYGCTGLKEISVPDGVTVINSGAFWNCSELTKVNLPDTVTSIKEDAFRRCYDLKEISLPASIIEIEKGAFQDSGLEVINFQGTSEQWSAIDGSFDLTNSGIRINCISEMQEAEKDEIDDNEKINSVPEKVIISYDGVIAYDVPGGKVEYRDVLEKGDCYKVYEEKDGWYKIYIRIDLGWPTYAMKYCWVREYEVTPTE